VWGAWTEIDRTNKTEDENKNVEKEKREKKGNGKCNLTLQ